MTRDKRLGITESDILLRVSNVVLLIIIIIEKGPVRFEMHSK